MLVSLVFWGASLALLILDWRSGKLFQHHQRDTPFQPPIRDEDMEAEDDEYVTVPPARQPRRAPSTGYDSPATSSGYHQPQQQQQQQARYSGVPTSHQQTPLSYSAAPAAAAGRPSMDAYGAFSDPAPSGFGSSGYNSQSAYGSSPSSHHRAAASQAPTIPEPEFGQPMVSRTMQYADPYAAVRASVTAGGSGVPPQQGLPPSYETYPGYW